MTLSCRRLKRLDPDRSRSSALDRVHRAGASRLLRGAALSAMVLALGGCAVGAGVGIGIPLASGLALNVGWGSGGPSVGLSTGWGPVGAGVSLDGGGRVLGSAGVGASAGHVGVGLGSSAVLYDPQAHPGPPSVTGAQPGVVVPGAAPSWRVPGEREAP